ncbi:hypothetical protein [Paenibacillus marinisediminis]
MIKYIILGLIFLITACTSQTTTENQSNWEISSTFEIDGVKVHGKKDRLIFAPQGESDISKGGHFLIYFWGKPDEIANTYSLIGIHKDTGTKKELYPNWEVSRAENKLGADAGSGAKFILDKKGLWRLEVYMGDKYFDSIVVEAN